MIKHEDFLSGLMSLGCILVFIGILLGFLGFNEKYILLCLVPAQGLVIFPTIYVFCVTFKKFLRDFKKKRR
jgi:hypothetical protein